MSLFKAASTVSLLTLASRITGLARELLIAATFGASALTDAFNVAFRIPNLFRRLFAEGAFSQAFVPVLATVKEQQGEEATRQLVDRVATVLAWVLLAVSVLGVLASPLLVWLMAAGLRKMEAGSAFDAAVVMTRWMFPYIACMSLVALAAGVLNTWSRFSVPAFTPVLLNVSLILAATVAAPWFDPPVLALAWGVLLGGALQLAMQFYALTRIGMLPKFTLDFSDPGVRRILTLMGPATLGVSVAQVSLLINTIFASFLDTGSVSWLYYADRLMEFPTGMMGVALGTVLLPSLAKHYSDESTEEFSRLLDWGLRLTLLLALPAAAALAVLSVPLIATLFLYGEFGSHDLWMTRQALMAYALGLLGLIMVKVLAPGFYARQNIRTPVKVAIFTLLATQAMNLAFIVPFKHAGLALAIGLGACLNAGLLYYLLRRHRIYTPQPGWGRFMLKIVVAVALMCGALYLAHGSDASWLQSGFLPRAVKLSWMVLLGAGVYLVALLAMGIRPAQFYRKAA